MDEIIARMNIEHFRKELARETEDARRDTLSRLLAEEEAKLEAWQVSGKRRQPSTHASASDEHSRDRRFLT